MNTLFVFYDGKCALCAKCRHWLESQPLYVNLVFLPYQSYKAKKLCPEIDSYDPGKEIVVMADNGDIYQGGAAWIMCLWATRSHREWGMRLASPALLPLAKKVCHLISDKRLILSRLFGKVSDEEIAETVSAEAAQKCESGTCGV